MEDVTLRNLKQIPGPPANHKVNGDPGNKPPDPESNSSNSSHCHTVDLFGVPIAALIIDGQERLCLAQISNTLLKKFSYNEIHNRRVALGINCVQCTPVQLEILRRANAMPVSSRRCGMISMREAERLCKSFLTENAPPKLPDNFSFDVYHECTWGCRGNFVPSRYNSSRAKCIRCAYCNVFSSPNKFIFHAHRTPNSKYLTPDGPNINSWRRHIKLVDSNPSDELLHAWEDVKAMFNGGSRKRSICESSNKLAPSSLGRPSAESISFRSEAQRLLPSPTKRSRYDHHSSQPDISFTPPGAASIPYPLIPLPNRSAATSIAESLPEDPSLTSQPYSVGGIFPRHLSSPPSFRHHPFMEFVWSGGRAGYPFAAASLWHKAVGMPFANTPGYYHPFVELDTVPQATTMNVDSSNSVLLKKRHLLYDIEHLKLGSLNPKTLPLRNQRAQLPDVRPMNACYTSAFSPVPTGNVCPDMERIIPGAAAENVLFPPKSPFRDCFVRFRDHDPAEIVSSNPQPKSQHDTSTADHDVNGLSSRSLSPDTPKLIIDDDLPDKSDSDGTVKATPLAVGRRDADAGAASPDERGDSHRDLEMERPTRSTSAEEAASPPGKLVEALPLSDRLAIHHHHHHHQQHSRYHITASSPLPSKAGDDQDHSTAKKQNEDLTESVATGESSQFQRELMVQQLLEREHRLNAEMELRRKAFLSFQQKYQENSATLGHFTR